MADKAQFLQLLQGYLDGSLDAAREQTFFKLVRQDAYRALLEEAMEDYLYGSNSLGPKIKESRLQEIEASILARPLRRRRFSWWQVAAALLLVALSAYWLVQQSREVSRTDQALAVLAPVSHKATLHIAGDKPVSLDNLVAADHGPTLIDQGHIAYMQGNEEGDTSMNVLENPIGSQVVQISLSDGTEVWLNAGSQLRYPSHFGPGRREVTLKGEAYFEVSKGRPEQGFTVHTRQMDVQVLGTRFNVNAYNNEICTKTTLLEGRVMVQTPNGDSAVIHPGQQAYQSASGVEVQDVDAQTYIAWKQGYFMFNRSSLSDIARQLQRWYAISVDYDSLPSLHFTGGISKSVPLSEVLEMLEKSGKVRFEFKDKRLSVPD